MTLIRLAVVSAIASFGIAGVPSSASAQDAAIQEFKLRVNAYMEFRSDFVIFVPPKPSSDPGAIEAASDALAMSLRAARPEARIGDIFTPEVAVAVRQRIQDALWQHRYSPADLMLDITSEAPGAPAHLAVNERFDWAFGAAMPGCLIAALPTLPRELQYRFVGGDLVLVDIDARLIVDILRLALVVN